MKLKIKLSLVFFIVLNIFATQSTFSQCPSIDYALINSCAKNTSGTEGVNEFVVFTTSASVAVSNYSLNYGTDPLPESAPIYILSGLNARTKNGSGTITAKNCSSSLNFVTSPSNVIPSGSRVVFIPSNFDQDYDLSILCSGVGIYVVYIDINASSPTPNWQAGGSFGNNPGSSRRYLQFTNGTNKCTSNIRNYNSGWATNADGNFVSWNGTGESAYGNNGCSFSLPPTINPGIVSEICFGSTTTTMPYNVTENPDKYTITWNTAALNSGFTNVIDGNLTNSPLAIYVSSSANPGTYSASLIVTNTTTGLSSSPQNIFVKINAIPSITSVIKGTSPICSGGNASFTINGTPNATVSYTINTEPTQIVVLNASGNAQVEVNQVTSDTTILLSQISLSSCSATVTNTETVIVSTPPNAGNLSGDQVICSNETATFISTIAGGLWSSSDTSIATVNPDGGLIKAVSSGSATITYTVAAIGGCTIPATATRLVTISSTPTVAISGRCIGKEYTLEAFPSSGVTYKWTQGTSPLLETKSKLVVKTLGSYTVEINNSGCKAEATENVTSFYCDIPKGISPNGDELNDYFDLSNLIVKKLEIFNRYGVKVYSKTNYKKEWDGKSDGGQELPDATYYYVIEEEGNSPITGWVYINR